MKKVLFKTLMFVQVIFCATMLVSCDTSDRWESKMQKAIGKGDFDEARSCVAKISSYPTKKAAYKKVTRAQVAFFINSGKVEQAYNIAQQDGFIMIFTELFMPKLSDIYDSQGKAKILQYLVKAEFENTPDLSDGMWEYGVNSKYNKEAIRYNSLLEQLITYVDISGDRTFAVQLVKFMKPIVVEIVGRDGVNSIVKLSNNPSYDIKNKLGL